VPEHPSAASLQSFLLGDLPPWAVKTVVAHLAHGCGRCEARVETLARRLFGDGTAAPAVSSEEEYDRAIDRAFATALAAHAAHCADTASGAPAEDPIPLESELLARAWSLPKPPHPASAAGAAGPAGRSREAQVCERLLAQSRACRLDDPQRMVDFARRACFAAENLDPGRYGEETVLDLQARTLAELANAHRVADDLEQADDCMRQAVLRSALGSGDPLLLARLMDILASLCCHRRELETAIELLDAVYAIYRDQGDEQRAGRALISKGLYTGYANDPRQALVLLTEGFERIDPARDPELALAAVHNILFCLVEVGRSREARPLLERFRPLYERYGGRLTGLKLRWVEGKIAVGCGEPEEAARSFAEVRQGYEEAGLGTACALVSLDLAAVWLRQGKVAPARQLVEQAIATFRAQRIDREALAALLLLRDACTHQGTALGMLRSVRLGLKRLELGLRFEPNAAP
jgi:tetratricopeptide (TPR) repeat protein